MKNDEFKFSLLMSVYYRDSPQHLWSAFESIEMSTLMPSEVCLVVDGEIGDELWNVIDEFLNKIKIKIIRLENNLGLGKALSFGIRHCSYEWVARFDSDDICTAQRFEKQAKLVSLFPELDLIGSWIAEFDVDCNNYHAIKKTPLKHHDIVSFSKSRNPFNHMTVMYRKASVLLAGGYQDDYLYEDYSLWVRMIMNGCITENIPEVLVYARAGNGMEIRRGGLRYALSEVRAQWSFYKLGFLSFSELVKNLIIRIPIRLAPGRIRKAIYRSSLRK